MRPLVLSVGLFLDLRPAVSLLGRVAVVLLGRVAEAELGLHLADDVGGVGQPYVAPPIVSAKSFGA